MHAGSRADRIVAMIALFSSVPVAALSQSRTLFELGLVVVLAAAAPLIAQVLRLPSILLLSRQKTSETNEPAEPLIRPVGSWQCEPERAGVKKV